jgi:nicotinamidase-related amidase
MKLALLVIDVQKAFFEFSPTTAQSLRGAIEYINAAIALFRDKHLPVICIQHLEESEKLVPGEVGYELPEELDILPTDLHIAKTHGNAFTWGGGRHYHRFLCGVLRVVDISGS